MEKLKMFKREKSFNQNKILVSKNNKIIILLSCRIYLFFALHFSSYDENINANPDASLRVQN